jgi:hypothetical protein
MYNFVNNMYKCTWFSLNNHESEVGEIHPSSSDFIGNDIISWRLTGKPTEFIGGRGAELAE